MNFTQLRAFHAVATTRGFTKAATSLNVTQPAVTRQLKALEEEHGIALFHRRGHRLELTESGKCLFAVSQRIFGLIAEASDIVTRESELQSGNLRVGADGPFFIMDILTAFKVRYPAVGLTVSMANANDIFHMLRSFEIDVAVVTVDKLEPDFHAIPYSGLDLVLLVPTDHPWRRRRKISLAKLKGHPVILREPASMTRQLFLEAMETAGARPEVVMELRSQAAVREAVVSGLGLAAELVGGRHQDERLIGLPIVEAPARLKVCVTSRRDRYGIRKVRAFFDLAETVGRLLADGSDAAAARSRNHNQK